MYLFKYDIKQTNIYISNLILNGILKIETDHLFHSLVDVLMKQSAIILDYY